jgi:hypothetical protein
MTSSTAKGSVQFTITAPPAGEATGVTRTFRLIAGMTEETLSTLVRTAFGLAPDDGVLLKEGHAMMPLAPAAVVSGGRYELFVQPARRAAADVAAAPAQQKATPSVRASAETSRPLLGLGEEKEASLPEFPEYPDGVNEWSAVVPREYADDYRHVGWATVTSKALPGKKPDSASSSKDCLGALECPVDGCQFTSRPLTRKKAREQKKPFCRTHTTTVTCESIGLRMTHSLLRAQELRYSACTVKIKFKTLPVTGRLKRQYVIQLAACRVRFHRSSEDDFVRRARSSAAPSSFCNACSASSTAKDHLIKHQPHRQEAAGGQSERATNSVVASQVQQQGLRQSPAP